MYSPSSSTTTRNSPNLLSPSAFGHHQQTLSPEPSQHSSSSATNTSTAFSHSEQSTTIAESSNADVQSVSSRQKKNFKTEYKSKFTPFDQYAYNEVTDSFVRTNATGGQQSSSSISGAKSNQDLSSNPSPTPLLLNVDAHGQGLRQSPNSLLITHEVGALGPSSIVTDHLNEPWYKEVVKRNEKANEYRFKSEVGHNSPLLNHTASSRAESPYALSERQLLSPEARMADSSAAVGEALPTSNRSVISEQQATSPLSVDSKQLPQYRFTPSDYKHDHLISHMANNNNFKLPKEQVEPTDKSMTVQPRRAQASASARSTGAQLRSRSQSTRRQPLASSAAQKETTVKTKSNQTTPTRTIVPRTQASATSRTPMISTAASKTTTRTTPTSRVSTTRTTLTAKTAPARTVTESSRATSATSKDMQKRVPTVKTTSRPMSNGTSATSSGGARSTASLSLSKKTTTATSTSSSRFNSNDQRPTTASHRSVPGKSVAHTARSPGTQLGSSPGHNLAMSKNNRSTSKTPTTKATSATLAVKSIKTPKAIAAAKEAAIASSAAAAVAASSVAASAGSTVSSSEDASKTPLVEDIVAESNSLVQQNPQLHQENSTNLITTTTEAGNMLADELAHAERAASEAAKQSHVNQRETHSFFNGERNDTDVSHAKVEFKDSEQVKSAELSENELFNGLAGGLVSAEDRFDSSERENSFESNANNQQQDMTTFNQQQQHRDHSYDDEPYSIMPTTSEDMKAETFIASKVKEPCAEQDLSAKLVLEKTLLSETEDFDGYKKTTSSSLLDDLSMEVLAEEKLTTKLDGKPVDKKQLNELNYEEDTDRSLNKPEESEEGKEVDLKEEIEDAQDPNKKLQTLDNPKTADGALETDSSSAEDEVHGKNDLKGIVPVELSGCALPGNTTAQDPPNQELEHDSEHSTLMPASSLDDTGASEEHSNSSFITGDKPALVEDNNESRSELFKSELSDRTVYNNEGEISKNKSDEQTKRCELYNDEDGLIASEPKILVDSSPALTAETSALQEGESDLSRKLKDDFAAETSTHGDSGLVQEALQDNLPSNTQDASFKDNAEPSVKGTDHDKFDQVEHENIEENQSSESEESERDVSNKNELLMNVADLLDVENRKKQEMARKSELARKNSSPQPQAEVLLSPHHLNEQLSELTSDCVARKSSESSELEIEKQEKEQDLEKLITWPQSDPHSGVSVEKPDKNLSKVSDPAYETELVASGQDKYEHLSDDTCLKQDVLEDSNQSSSESETEETERKANSPSNKVHNSKSESNTLVESISGGNKNEDLDMDDQLKLSNHLTNSEDELILAPRNYNYNPVSSGSPLRFKEGSASGLLAQEERIDGAVNLEDGSSAEIQAPSLVEDRIEMSTTKLPEISLNYTFKRNLTDDSDDEVESGTAKNLIDAAATLSHSSKISGNVADEPLNLIGSDPPESDQNYDTNEGLEIGGGLVSDSQQRTTDATTSRISESLEQIYSETLEDEPKKHGELYKQLNKTQEERKSSLDFDEHAFRRKQSASTSSSSSSTSRSSLEKVPLGDDLKRDYDQFSPKMTADIVAKSDNNNTSRTSLEKAEESPVETKDNQSSEGTSEVSAINSDTKGVVDLLD